MPERELFLEWLYDNTSYDHVYIRGEREEDGVFHSDTIQSLWKAWQASASRGGYKLVPVETLKESLGWACIAEWDSPNKETDEEIRKHKSIIEKAITGTVE